MAPNRSFGRFRPCKIIGLAPNQLAYRILVVEDDRMSRFLMVKLLKSCGFEVGEAVNGRDAVALCQDWSPHLIWMDIQMPVMDGCEASRKIKGIGNPQRAPVDQQNNDVERDRAAQTPILEPHTTPIIIVLTASAFVEDRANILASGFDDIVYKPFRRAVIFDKMAQYLGVRYCYETPS